MFEIFEFSTVIEHFQFHGVNEDQSNEDKRPP